MVEQCHSHNTVYNVCDSDDMESSNLGGNINVNSQNSILNRCFTVNL